MVGATTSTAAARVGSAPPQPNPPVAAQLYPGAADAVGVDLGDPAPRGPGLATAYAGLTLYKNAAHGLQTFRLAYPSTTPTQAVVGTPRLQVVDMAGHPVDCIAHYTVATMPEAPSRSELRVTFDVGRMPDQSFFRYDVTTQVGDAPLDMSRPLPLPGPNDIPAAMKRYLVDEPNIQVHAPEVQQAAALIRSQSPTLQALVANTRRFMASLPQVGTLQFDAVGFLHSGVGSCTSNGHLFSALMRANGVPCRPVTGILRGMGQDMHWQDEYYVPGQGWAHIEPQGGDTSSEPQSPRFEIIETGPVEPEMDTSVSNQYFMDFLGQPVDAADRPMPYEQSALVAADGLFVKRPTFDSDLHIFGGT